MFNALKKIDPSLYEFIKHPERFKQVRKKSLFGTIIKLKREKGKRNEVKKAKILIFEDDPFLREMYEARFSKNCFEVKAFENPTKDIVSLVAKEKPDIIYLNIVMPVMDGFEAIKLLKADKRTKSIPVIFVSNISQREAIKKGLSLGAIDYLVTAQQTPTKVVEIFKKHLIKTRKNERKKIK